MLKVTDNWHYWHLLTSVDKFLILTSTYRHFYDATNDENYEIEEKGRQDDDDDDGKKPNE